MTEKPTIFCFGEVLWDCLPRGLFLGGAPCNVAYHLTRHGAKAAVVSAVGADFLGDEIVRRASGWGLDTRFLAVSRDLPTGTVQVDVSAGQPRYTIIEDVAWDVIPASDALADAAETASAMVFGTLALRTSANRDSLRWLLGAGKAMRVLDINLRPPFVDPSVIAFALGLADFVKLNDNELATLTDKSFATGPAAIGAQAAEFAAGHRLQRVCVTCGARGAGLMWDREWLWEDAYPVTVRDTVGAGDAFLAALLTGALASKPPAECLTAACRIGEFVAASDGATPDY